MSTRRWPRDPPLRALAVALALAGATAAGAASAGAPSQERPRTLAVLPERVVAFAHAGGQVAWIAKGRCVPSVRSLRTGVQTELAPQDCRGRFREAYQDTVPEGGLAFDGSRAVWSRERYSLGGEYHQAFSAAVHDRRPHRVGYAAEDNMTAPEFTPYRGLIAGSPAGLLLYQFCDYDCDLSSGGIRRVRGARTVDLSPGPRESRLLDLELARTRYATVHTEVTHFGCGCSEAPAWSPDGRSLVYAARASHQRAPTNLVVVPLDGSTPPRRLTAEAGGVSSPEWSPDGRSIAAVSRGAVIVVEVATGAVTRVTAGMAPAWAPDGTRLAFLEWRSGPGPFDVDVSLVDARAGAVPTPLATLTDVGLAFDLAWRPDGRALAVATGDGIWEVSVHDGGRRELVPGVAAEGSVDWSPDGRRLLYAGIDADQPTLRIVSVGGGARRSVRFGPPGLDVSFDGTWSPDGTRIAFASDYRDPGWGGEIYVADAATGRVLRSLTLSRPRQLSAVAEVRRLRDGRLLRTVRSPGTVARDLALSESVLAVLAKGTDGRRFELTDLRSGRGLGTVAAPAGAADPKAVGDVIVFAVGRKIHALDARTGRLRMLAAAASTPIGLSLDGRRLAWAENRRRGAVVRSLEVR